MSRNGQLPRAEIPTALIRPVECRAFDIGEGETFAPHAHDWAQFTYSAEGVLTVSTNEGRFTAPPAMAVWIPPGVTHEIRTVGAAKFRSLYIAKDRAAGMPAHCAVLTVDPLLRQLVLEAVALPREWDASGAPGRLMTVVLDRIRIAERAKLDLPLPSDRRLRCITDALLADPADRRDLDRFARQAGAASRTLARLFKKETGMTFGAWRRRRVLVAALERLNDGAPVTSVALDLGYESPSAFIAMFKRVLGATPSRYMQG